MIPGMTAYELLTNPAGAARGKQYLSPEERDEELRNLTQNTGSMLETVFKTLDTPAAIARGILAGDPASGFSWDTDRRTSGTELLDSYGLLPSSDGTTSNSMLRSAAGFGAEILTDPLSWVTLPMASLSKAGKAAKAANIIDYAPIAAQRRMGDAGAAATMAGRYTDKAYERLLPMGLARNEANYAVRPLVGPRLARATTTLDEVVQAADDPVEALNRVTQFLSKTNTPYDAVRDQKLGGAFGIGLMSPMVTFTPPGGLAALDAMDAVGQAIGWSAPARYASSFFDQRVAGQTSAADQMAALRHFKAVDTAKQVGRREAAKHADILAMIPMDDQAKALLGADSLMSPQGNEFLTRLFENKPTRADLALKASLPGIDNALASWQRLRNNNVQAAKDLGIALDEFKDKRFGVQYSPRSGSEFDFGEFGSGGSGRTVFSAHTAEAITRNPALFTPGGTSDLREISMLPMIREHAQKGTASPYSNAQIGQEIVSFLDRKHGRGMVDQAQGEAIAGVMQRINKDLPSDIPAFAEHPINAQSRVIVSQEVARANARYIYDSLIESAAMQPAAQVTGGRFKSVASAIDELAGRMGLRKEGGGLDPAVKKQLIDRAAAKFGVAPGQLDLNQISIPEQVYDRLARIGDFYTVPRAQQEVGNLFDAATTLFKSFVLAWPSRHVRDMYSNTFSIWLETGSVRDTYNGLKVAKRILGGDMEGALDDIAKLPQYQGIANRDDLRRRFTEDAASSGVLTTLASSDVLSSRVAGDVNQLVPGFSPMTRLGSFGEFIPDGSRNPLQMAYDFTQIRGVTNKYETRNPLLNWSQKLNDANDSIARLGSYVALLSKGVSPEAAAKRTAAALVDYSSLTPFERAFARRVFPWWSYSSRIGTYVVQSLMENPGGRYGQAIRAMNTLQESDENSYVPSWMRQQFSFPIDKQLLDMIGMTPPEGMQVRGRDLDFPGIDAVFGTINPQSVSATARNVLSQTNPFIKGIGELAFNQDLFTGQPLSEADTPADRIYKYLSQDPRGLSPLAKVVANNIPGTQRIASLAGGLMDDDLPDLRQRMIKQGINNVTGVKVVNIKPKAMRNDAMQLLADDLATSGITRSHTIVSYPDELLVGAPPSVQRKVLLAKQLASEEAKDRREQERVRTTPFDPLGMLGGRR